MSGSLASPSQRSAWDALLPFRFVVWALLLGPLLRFQADPDLWGHVRFGGDIVRNRALPTWDTYSFTSDVPWVNHEWLSEVTMYGAYSAGPVGLSLLRLALLALLGFVVARHLAEARLGPIWQDGLLAIGVVGLAGQVGTLRPQLWSLLCFAVLLRTLSVPTTPWRSLILAVLMMVWANVHGGWVVGGGVLLTWASVGLLRDHGAVVGATRRFALAVLPLLALLVNPYGVGLLKFAMETVGLGRAEISEWQGVLGQADSTAMFRWALTFALASSAALLNLERLDLRSATVVLMLGAASFRVARLSAFFTLGAIMLLGPLLGRVSDRPRQKQPPPAAHAAALLWLVAAVFVAWWTIPRVARLGCIDIPEKPWVPDHEAVRALEQAGHGGRLVTYFDFGEYAIWHLAPDFKVSMDGRRETVYSARVIDKHFDGYRGRPGGIDYIAGLGAQYAWLPSGLPLVGDLEARGWRVIHAGARSVVLVAPGVEAREPRPAVSAVRAGHACFPGG